MKRIERECMKCGGRRWLGDFDICKMPLIFIPQEQGKCTLCGNKWKFRIVITEVKEETNDEKQS